MKKLLFAVSISLLFFGFISCSDYMCQEFPTDEKLRDTIGVTEADSNAKSSTAKEGKKATLVSAPLSADEIPDSEWISVNLAETELLSEKWYLSYRFQVTAGMTYTVFWKDASYSPKDSFIPVVEVSCGTEPGEVDIFNIAYGRSGFESGVAFIPTMTGTVYLNLIPHTGLSGNFDFAVAKDKTAIRPEYDGASLGE